MVSSLPVQRLEQYTLKRPQEVLLLHSLWEGEADEIVVYKGFSSSLVHSTAFDPEIPLLSENADIISIDRLKSPYDPHSPAYIEQGLRWEEMEQLLLDLGI